MRKLIMFNMISLDGFFEGPNRDIEWHNTDEEFNDFAIAQLESGDGLIFGRVTYQLMESYWPTAGALKDDPIIAAKMNSLPKVVFSRTLDKAEWNNTRLVKSDAAAEVARLRQETGKDLFLFGSANLASSLTPRGLIDEYRIIVNPMVLGSGTPLFKNAKDRLHLKLVNSRTFRSGNVLLYYQTDKR